MLRKIIWQLFCLLLAVGAAETLRAQSTAFLYQGRLNDSGSPATGTYDFTFSLYPTNQTGALAAVPVTNLAVAVSSGLFTATLDFGPGIFRGPNYWMQIAVRTNGAVTFTNLTPRQPLLPVPYAIFANSASNLLGTLASTQLSGTLPASAFTGYTNTVALINSGNLFGGTFSGDGAGLANLNGSQITSGTVADARLSSNVALLNANQTFSGTNVFNGGNTFTNLRGNSFSGSFFGNGLVGWLVPTGTVVQAVIDTGYLLTNTLEVAVRLPATPSPVDIVRISGAGSGGWTVLQNSNQFIIGNFSGFTNSSWQQSSVGNENWASIASSGDGTKMLAAANGGVSPNLYVSTDSGKTWSAASGSGSPNPAQYQAVASSADGVKLVAAINNGTLYTSSNSGSTWVSRSGGGAPLSTTWSSLASSSDGVRLVGVVNGGNIWVSGNSGASWTSQASPRTWFSVASSANGSNLVAVVTSGGSIWTNSGSSWLQSSAPAKSWTSVASSADGKYLAAVEAGGQIYTSFNAGSTWTQQTNAPSLTWASIASSADGGKLVAASQNGGIYNSINYGVTWTQQPGTPGKAWNCITSSADGGRLAAGVFGGGIYSAQAASQVATTPGVNGGISGIQGSAVELQYIGNNQFMPVSSAGTIWAN
ncbi:MAG TPA: hypothetical protein VNN22_21815 [Verrucomicrobiae bacterium]|nr:hypothetical protein [Verrucomicrobiae bacterium]